MEIRLVIALWDNVKFGGRKRTFIDSFENLGDSLFNDVTSAIGIHTGPDFVAGDTETVSFFEDVNFKGKELVLAPGVYPDLGQLNFNDTISSFKFNGAVPRAPGVYLNGVQQVPLAQAIPPAAKIAPIPLVIELYQNIIPRNPFDPTHLPENFRFGNRWIYLVESALNLASMFGNEFNDTASAVIVKQGPNFNNHIARLFADVQQDNGQMFGGHIDLAPGVYANLGELGFNDVISAVKIV